MSELVGQAYLAKYLILLVFAAMQRNSLDSKVITNQFDSIDLI